MSDITLKLNKILDKYLIWIIFVVSVSLSFFSFLFFFQGSQNLADYDAIARLNIARKTFDSITPGLGQLGGTWLPLPQFLMIPFTAVDGLWRSGIAGAIVSMTAFIFSCLYIYKTILLLTNNKLAAVGGWIVYMLNINLLLLQTSAMSESFFLFTMIMSIYFLLKWVLTNNLSFLLISGIFVALITLTRYEGYAVFLASVIVVFLVSVLKYKGKNKSKTEGTLIMYITIAAMGLVIWTIYSWAIYGDPIYWLNLYTGNKTYQFIVQPISEVSSAAVSSHRSTRNLFESFVAYGWASSLMLGIPTLIAFAFGYFVFVFDTFMGMIRKNKDVKSYLALIIISTVLVAYLFFGYFLGLIPIIQTPAMSLASLMDRASNFSSSTNIRYGIILLPLACIFIGYLMSRLRIFGFLIIFLLMVQFVAYFKGSYMLTFDLSKKWNYSVPSSITWFKENYDSGKVLISAHRREPFMLQSGLSYDSFIYEGSRDYWVDSLRNPSKYATWIVYDSETEGDYVKEYIDGTNKLDMYDLVYDNKSFKIYKIKTKPEKEIKK